MSLANATPTKPDRVADLRRVWRRDPPEFGYLDEDDLRVLERARRGAGVLAVLCGCVVIGGYLGAGFAGLVVALTVVAVIALLILALGVPAAPIRRRRRRRRAPPFDAPYPTFQHVSEQLSWAEVSPRHYDMVTRPLLVRLMASRLSDHHGVDLHREPERARAVVGDDLWWWLDPTRPVQGSSQPPGVDVRTLTRLVERLERL
jgi:hypothetical protein